jgi:hypothetical protein
MYIKPSMPGIELLNDTNYGTWHLRLMMAAEHLELWQAFVTDMTGTEIDRRAKTFIGMHVSDLHLSTVMSCTSAKDAWDTLHSTFAASSKSRALLLRRAMVGFSMGPNQSVLSYVNEAKELQRDLALAGEPLMADQVVSMVLAGLPDRFSTVVQILQHSMASATMNDVLTKLLVAEQMVAAREKEPPTAYLGHANTGGILKRARFPEDGGSSRAGGQQQGGGRQSGGGDQRSGQFGRSNGDGPFKGTCWHCNEVGHKKSDCKLFKAKKHRADHAAHLASGQDIGATGDAF